MTELPLTDDQANALHGTTDSDTDFKYHCPGEASYFTEGQRQRHRLLTLAKAISNSLRVYRDGAMTFGVRPGSAGDGGATYAYEGCAGNALTDDATNYIYLTATNLAAGNTVTVNTTGFPLQSQTPHIPLAKIVTSDGGYDGDDISDLRSASALAVRSALAAAAANTLVAGSASNADALHIHAAAGLAAAVQDLMPALTITASAESSHARTITIQAKDAAGNSLSERCAVNFWVSTTAYGAPAATGTDTFTGPTAGGILRTLTAKADYYIQTDATGAYIFVLTHNDAGSSRYIMAEIDGKIYASGEITFNAV
jgi:hypothetical protein